MKSTIVLLDDIRVVLEVMEGIIRDMPESQGLDIASFTNDKDAAKFVSKHRSQIIGYVQDLRRNELDLKTLHGIRFFNEVIDPLTPNTKTLIHSGYIEYQVVTDMYERAPKRIAFLQKSGTLKSFEEFRDKILWLLEPLSSKEITEDHSSIFNAPQLVTLISQPWEEICRYIANNPSFLHTMNPRKFEELIAQIFMDYGWHVDLTAQTRDGGYDIVAIRRSYPADLKLLIEAKRYAPDHVVGVQVVRSLYGVRLLNAASQVILATSSHVSRDAKKEFERVVPWELNFIERDEILAWCHKHGGVTVSGSFKPSQSA